MAYIKYSAGFAKMHALFKAMKKKHDEDLLSGSSVVTAFLTEHNINLNDEESAADDALAIHEEFKSKSKETEALFEQGNVLFKPVFTDHNGLVQFLKNLKRGRERALGEWGVTVNNKARIVYPKKISLRIKCVKDFIAKHNSFAPPTSPVQPYIDEHNIDMAQNLLDAASAETIHDAAVAAAKLKEQLRELRDVKMKTPADHLRGIGQYLVSLFDNNPHKLGEWGFEINEAGSKPRQRLYLISAMQTKTIFNTVLGSEVYNDSDVPVKLIPRKGSKASPVILEGLKSFTVKRGFSHFTAINENTGEKIRLKVTVRP